jgi:hypothetical protein
MTKCLKHLCLQIEETTVYSTQRNLGLVAKLGRGALMAKFHVQSAYRHYMHDKIDFFKIQLVTCILSGVFNYFVSNLV